MHDVLVADNIREIEDAFHLKTYEKFPLTVVKGEDVWVYDEKGNRYLDLYGGHAVVSAGHCHPEIVKAVREQAGKLIFYSNVVYNDARAKALSDLGSVAPEGLKNIFFVNSGAEANENAIKLARKATGKTKIISFDGSFHGRTLGALSVTGMEKYRIGTEKYISENCFAQFGNIDSVPELIDENTAGIILEVIQSMGGVNVAEKKFYADLRALCDERGIILIYDEVQTGMGRTGDYFFASFNPKPDILTTAKGIAGGFPMGAVLVNDKIASAIRFNDLGTTFGGGPIACAALSATVQVIREENLFENVRINSKYLFQKLSEYPFVEKVTGMGYLVGICFRSGLKMPENKPAAKYFQEYLFSKKILTGLSSDPYVLRLLPPLTLRRKEIDYFLEVLEESEAGL